VLDLGALRSEHLARSLQARGCGEDLDRLLKLDARRRELLRQLETLRARRGRLSRAAAVLPPDHPLRRAIARQVRRTAGRRRQLARAVGDVQRKLRQLLAACPNLLDPDVPPADVVLERHGSPAPARRTAAAVLMCLREQAGNGYWGEAARLGRALLHFGLDFFRGYGYKEFFPGPAAGAPVSGVRALEGAELRYVTVDTGPYADILGTPGPVVLRVRLVDPADWRPHLDTMLRESEALVGELELPYRLVLVGAGRLGTAARLGYALETYLPATKVWAVVAAVSHHGEYLARRHDIRAGHHRRLVHSLFAAGPVLHAVLTAVLEAGAQEDGSVRLPCALARQLGQRYLEPQERTRIESP